MRCALVTTRIRKADYTPQELPLNKSPHGDLVSYVSPDNIRQTLPGLEPNSQRKRTGSIFDR